MVYFNKDKILIAIGMGCVGAVVGLVALAVLVRGVALPRLSVRPSFTPFQMSYRNFLLNPFDHPLALWIHAFVFVAPCIGGPFLALKLYDTFKKKKEGGAAPAVSSPASALRDQSAKRSSNSMRESPA